MIYIIPNFMPCMGKRERQFLRMIADGLGTKIDDGPESGGPAGRTAREFL